MNPNEPVSVIKIEPIKPAQSLLETSASAFNTAGGDTFAPVESILAGARLGNGIVQFLKVGILWLARGLIVPIEAVLRYHIGERYFNQAVILACIIGLTLGYLLQQLTDGAAFNLFYACFLGVQWHAYRAFKRDRRGEYWHSYSEGESRFRVPFIDAYLIKNHYTFDFSKLILEPAIVLIVAFTIAPQLSRVYVSKSNFLQTSGYYVYPYKTYFLTAGTLMFVYQLYCWHIRRHLMLDEKDARIIAEAKQLALSQPTTQPTIRNHCGVAYLPKVERKHQP